MSAPVWRLAIVNTHPIQYFAPLYAYLNRDPQLEVTALYCTDFSLRGAVDPGFGREVVWDIDLLQGYRAVFLGSRARKRTPRGFFSLICPEIWSEIRNGQYDAVILHGYQFASHMLAFLAARSRGLPVFIRGDTNPMTTRSGLRTWIRRTVVGAFFRRMSGCLAVGSANRAYYRSLGVTDERIFPVPFAVDNERFMRAAQLIEADRAAGRRAMGFEEDIAVVAFAAKFDLFKYPVVLIDAVARLQHAGINIGLLMIGSGQLEPLAQARVTDLGLRNVRFTGFCNQAELPRLLAISNVFVLAAEREAWGLVVNEAMCARLPVIVGNEMGCAPDLVRDGVNGRLVRAGNVDALADALADILAAERRRLAMGAESRRIIDHWGYAECAEGVKAALSSTINQLRQGVTQT